MARAYGAMLGMTAFAVVSLRGIARGNLAVDTLPMGLQALLVFAVIGFFAGAACDRLIRQSIEQRFRESVEMFGRELEARIARVGDSWAEDTARKLR